MTALGETYCRFMLFFSIVSRGVCLRMVDLDYGEPYDAGLIIINHFEHALSNGGAPK